ncbi:MAG: o-succinylbenzoate synthase [Luteibaculaceae bacterium]
MPFSIEFTPHTLQFIVPGGTSRGVLTEKPSGLLSVSKNGVTGYGEYSIIPGLSIDKTEKLAFYLTKLKEKPEPDFWLKNTDFLEELPALYFALETALLDFANGGKKQIYQNAFSRGETGIPINGLIWMGTKEFMLAQIKEKIDEGYNCLKVKIGAIDYETEISILQHIRKVYSKKNLILRVDANGAFSYEQAQKVLNDLEKLHVHSIEQPIKQGQVEWMERLCASTPTPIALDEELIGIFGLEGKKDLLKAIKPQYIILKPSLLGGLKASQEWIETAKAQNIDYWITSALEGNVGLNAVAQFTYEQKASGHQGLGTGKLFSNNWNSPLYIEKGYLWYGDNTAWNVK